MIFVAAGRAGVQSKCALTLTRGPLTTSLENGFGSGLPPTHLARGDVRHIPFLALGLTQD